MALRDLKYGVIYLVVCPLAAWALRFYAWLTRYRTRNPEADPCARGEGPVIYCSFHSQLLYGQFHFIRHPERIANVTYMFSPSRDGEILARIWRRLGARVQRGSSSKRRTSILKSLLRELEEGHSVAVALDGPRGPRGVVKEGALALSKMSGRPIFAFYGRARRVWRLRSWDRHEIPKPFGRAEGIFLEPFVVPPDAGPEEMDACRERLARALREFDDDKYSEP